VREAIAAWHRSIVLKERVGATASALLTWASMSGVLTVMGEREAARRAQQRVLDVERADARTPISLAWSNRGDLEVMDGRLDEAIEAYERGERGYRELGMGQLRAHALTGGIRAMLLRDAPGDLDRARRWLADLEETTGDAPARDDERRLLTARAMIRDRSEDTGGALADARAAARIRASDTAYEDAFGSSVDARWMVAVLLHRLGRSADAARAAARAEELLVRRARALDDDTDRRRFVEDHPLHRTVAAGRLDQPPGRSWSPRVS
jgi:tetratricopeptide (TPR) repeat protein